MKQETGIVFFPSQTCSNQTCSQTTKLRSEARRLSKVCHICPVRPNDTSIEVVHRKFSLMSCFYQMLKSCKMHREFGLVLRAVLLSYALIRNVNTHAFACKIGSKIEHLPSAEPMFILRVCCSLILAKVALILGLREVHASFSGGPSCLLETILTRWVGNRIAPGNANDSDVPRLYIRFSPLIGGPSFLPLHSTIYVDDGEGGLVGWDFLPENATDPATLRRIISLRSTEGLVRERRLRGVSRSGLMRIGTVAPSLLNSSISTLRKKAFHQETKLHLLTNQCWKHSITMAMFALGLTSLSADTDAE
eukprot:g4172.t1